MKLLVYLLLLFSPVAHAQWKPHINSLNGQVRVIASILKQHPDFFKQNVKYKANPLLTLKPVPYIYSLLGRNAQDLTFGQVLRMSTEYTDEGELVYDEGKVELLKADILTSLSNIFLSTQDLELEKLNADLTKMSDRGTELLKDYIKLIPFFYNSDGDPLIITLNDESLAVISDKITEATASELDNYYNDLLPSQSEKYINEIQDDKISSAVSSFKKDFIAGKKSTVFIDALTPLSTTGKMLKKRAASIEELPALVGIFRGNFGRTCATREIPYYPLVKGTKVYLIRKSTDFSAPDAGFAFVAPVNIDGKVLPYIITVNGPSLTNVDTREVIRMIAKAWGTETIVLSNLNLNPMLINTASVKEGMRFENSIEMNDVVMPKGWGYIDDDVKKRSSGIDGIYYAASRLKNALLVTLDKPSTGTRLYGGTSYKRVNPKDMSLTERAIAAVYCADGYGRDEQEVLAQFNVTEKQLEAAETIINVSPLTPFNAEQFKLLSEEIDFGFSDLANFDIGTRTNSLIKLHEESPEITTGKGWSSAFTAVNKKLTSLILEAENDESIVKLINKKISTPEKYWIDDIVEGITHKYDADLTLKTLELIFKKYKEWPEKVWSTIPSLLNSSDDVLRKGVIGLLPLHDDLSMNTWHIIVSWLQSEDEQKIADGLTAIKKKQTLPTGAWEALSYLLINGSTTVRSQVTQLLDKIDVWHHDFWDTAPLFLETYEGACIIVNKKTWPDYFWKKVPTLMQSKSAKVRWGIMMGLEQKETWPDNVWEQIPKMINDTDADVKNVVESILKTRGTLIGSSTTDNVNTVATGIKTNVGTDKVDANSLSKMIDNIEDSKDIKKIEIIFEDNLGDQEFAILYEKFKVMKAKIEANEETDLADLDERSILLKYTGEENSISDKDLVGRTIDKMAADFKGNNDLFPETALKYIAREDVVIFMLQNSTGDASAFKVLNSFVGTMEISGNKYKVDYYTKPEFEKFKTEIYDLKMLKK
jgi:hypothetical protein